MEALLLLLIYFSNLVSSINGANDTIHVNQSLKDGETIVSSGGNFELGFFNSSSQRRYLGIWYTFSRDTKVWVANRDVPLNDTSGVLQVTNHGNLVMISGSNNVTVWSRGGSTWARNPIAQLLDSGNFVLREADDTSEESYLWESFGYGGFEDTTLAGGKVGKNLVTGLEWHGVSWKSPSDPSFGDTTKRLETSGYPQFYIALNGSVVFRSGPWNGFTFGGLTQMKPNPIRASQLVYTEEEIYDLYKMIDDSVFFRIVLNNGGNMQQLLWNKSIGKWDTYSNFHRDDCDKYAVCGAFGSCSLSTNLSPICNCLPGFTPRFANEWASGNWSGGCARKNELVCRGGVNFQRIDQVKVPDASKSWFNRTMNLTECEKVCAKNCSCTAYTALDVSTVEGCLLWSDDLVDIREYVGNGQFFYLKISNFESGLTDRGSKSGKNKLRLGLVIGSAVSMGILILGVIIYICNKKHRNQGTIRKLHKMIFDNKEGKEEVNFRLFDLDTIAQATGGFSNEHLIGKGGFGPVYKGTLVDGQEIAVKRLSKNSGQGAEEFKNEVVLVAKLQHNNLARLFGCCTEGDEKMLIYEFMPNKSLDYFIFDQKRRKMLDWNTRILIIVGVGRGLLYLHQDSRLRVIHRDLKTSNVLLDASLTPKISDFGLARMMTGDQTEAKTKKVSGTYGYMPPEYAIDGRFSMKSDVFSFGVLVLEIISGERNRGFSCIDHSFNLLGHAWKLWTEGRPLDLVAETSDDPYPEPEVKRCIHIGLLCVQQKPQDRPNMDFVVLMLSSETPLPDPKQPGFYVSRDIPKCSLNDVSLTLLEAR